MSDARIEILGRIRTALADRPEPHATPERLVPGMEREVAQGGVTEALFAERVADYTAHIAGGDDVRALVADACERHHASRIAVPEGVPPDWIPETIEAIPVGDPDVALLDGVDGVLTTSALAIAETGTIVLDGGPGQGPRAATLLPDLHICVVDPAAIVQTVPEAIAKLGEDVGRPVTFISGPSATSDIELERVEGVHGPRRLEVILAR